MFFDKNTIQFAYFGLKINLIPKILTKVLFVPLF